jgi:hypothetical protein
VTRVTPRCPGFSPPPIGRRDRSGQLTRRAHLPYKAWEMNDAATPNTAGRFIAAPVLRAILSALAGLLLLL